VHPNPGPLLNILQWNAAGCIASKQQFISHIAQRRSTDIILLQELKTATNTQLKIQNFNVVARPRDQYGGGVAIALKIGVKYEVVKHRIPETLQTSIEAVTVLVYQDKEPIAITCVYAPPGGDFPTMVLDTLLRSIDPTMPHLLAGDFYAH
jgi:exonuclease III